MVEKTIKPLNNFKTSGANTVTVKIMEAMGKLSMDIIDKLFSTVWTTGYWPNEWCKLHFVPLLQKGSHIDCTKYRMIAWINDASKIILLIIKSLLKYFLSPETRLVFARNIEEQILNARPNIEKAYEFNFTAYRFFMNYSKAFDCVK